jgi:cobalamin biosynthesis protein CobD/CbiB
VATTDRLAARRKELRRALAEVVTVAAESGWVDAARAKCWLRKLEEGRTLREGWPKYARGGALAVSLGTTSPNNVVREACQRTHIHSTGRKITCVNRSLGG